MPSFLPRFACVAEYELGYCRVFTQFERDLLLPSMLPSSAYILVPLRATSMRAHFAAAHPVHGCELGESKCQFIAQFRA